MKKNPYNFNEIPTELKNLPQWVLWRKEERNGKPTKIPYQANGEMAQANNRRTWSTFATAVKFYLEGDYDGIGFVFSRQDNYIGIDIDKCVVAGKTNTFATEIIDTLDSYTEFSPSGKRYPHHYQREPSTICFRYWKEEYQAWFRNLLIRTILHIHWKSRKFLMMCMIVRMN
ncbi:hypothetical protein ACT7C1_22780 [Bacillus paranthracis]